MSFDWLVRRREPLEGVPFSRISAKSIEYTTGGFSKYSGGIWRVNTPDIVFLLIISWL